MHVPSLSPLPPAPASLGEPHIAEYTALTTRMTYWIYIQYVMYAIAGAAFGAVLAYLPESAKLYQGWMLLFILIATQWALLQSQDEILTLALYIETYLKPLPSGGLTDQRPVTWEWERFRIQRRAMRAEGLDVVLPHRIPIGLKDTLTQLINKLVKFEGNAGIAVPIAIGALAAVSLVIVRFREASYDHQLTGRALLWNATWLVLCVYMLVMVAAKGLYNAGLRAELNNAAQLTSNE